ncbi:MAG: dihydrolipoyl dehydrogenase [Candidatus Aminicenantales bacterium]
MTYDIAVIGGGPGGYVGALRAAQLGKKVILFEDENLGGTCMNWGCIPAKYLLEQTKLFAQAKESPLLVGPKHELQCDWEKVQRGKNELVRRFTRGIAFLLEKNGVNLVHGHARLVEPHQIEVEGPDAASRYEADSIILATGARPAALPFLRPDGKDILTSREALDLSQIPKDMLIIGAGAIGLELGTMFQRIGTEVTVLEMMPTILPGADAEVTQRLERLLKKQGLRIFTGVKITHADKASGKITVAGKHADKPQPLSFSAEKVLLAVGRTPRSEILEPLSSEFLDEKGFVRVSQELETNLPGVYAVGDLIGGKLLAHKASHEGIIAAENASGAHRRMDYRALPMAVFTDPEFASVGLTEQQAQQQGFPVKSGVFFLQANGRAMTMGKPDGMVKILADDKDRIIGAHLLAPGASEILGELVLATANRMRLEDVGNLVHIHPTLSEAVMEAALKAQGKALHALNA